MIDNIISKKEARKLFIIRYLYNPQQTIEEYGLGRFKTDGTLGPRRLFNSLWSKKQFKESVIKEQTIQKI